MGPGARPQPIFYYDAVWASQMATGERIFWDLCMKNAKSFFIEEIRTDSRHWYRQRWISEQPGISLHTPHRTFVQLDAFWLRQCLSFFRITIHFFRPTFRFWFTTRNCSLLISFNWILHKHFESKHETGCCFGCWCHVTTSTFVIGHGQGVL